MLNVSPVAVPIILPNRWTDTARTTSDMAQLGRSRPPSSATEMWRGSPRSRLVSKTTMASWMGRVLNRSTEATMQERPANSHLTCSGSLTSSERGVPNAD